MSTVRASSASPSTSRKAVKASASASAPSSRPPTRGSDPYYGHEDTAVLCSRFITSLFQCPNIPTATVPGAPTPALAHFVAYALHRTRLPSIVTFAALLLLQRLKTRFPAARGSSGHRLFISAFMIASKVICDDTYSNQSWSIVAQKMFALKEINQMEREMCGYLEWNLNVAGTEIAQFETRVQLEHGSSSRSSFAPIPSSSSAYASSSSSSSSSVATPAMAASSHAYPTPDATPDSARPIKPVPSPYKSKPQPAYGTNFPPSPQSPVNLQQHSSQSHHHHHAYHLSPPQFASANSSLTSSPASEDCKTPSPVAMTQQSSSSSHHHHSHPHSSHHSQHQRGKSSVDYSSRRHAQPHYPITAGGW